MKNWLGQEIEEGDLVYYGARSGNTSTYRLGKVVSFPERKPISRWYESELGPQNVRVEWIAEPGIKWEKDEFGKTHRIDGIRKPSVGVSTLALDGVVKIDVDLDSIQFL